MYLDYLSSGDFHHLALFILECQVFLIVKNLFGDVKTKKIKKGLNRRQQPLPVEPQSHKRTNNIKNITLLAKQSQTLYLHIIMMR